MYVFLLMVLSHLLASVSYGIFIIPVFWVLKVHAWGTPSGEMFKGFLCNPNSIYCLLCSHLVNAIMMSIFSRDIPLAEAFLWRADVCPIPVAITTNNRKRNLSEVADPTSL